jgi:hypothetical protein
MLESSLLLHPAVVVALPLPHPFGGGGLAFGVEAVLRFAPPMKRNSPTAPSATAVLYTPVFAPSLGSLG